MSHVSPISKPRCHWMSCPNIGKSDQTLGRCSGCMSVLYCGRSCQRSDWPKHKKVCKIAQNCKKLENTREVNSAEAMELFKGIFIELNRTQEEIKTAVLNSNHGDLSSNNRKTLAIMQPKVNELEQLVGEVQGIVSEVYTDSPPNVSDLVSQAKEKLLRGIHLDDEMIDICESIVNAS